MDRLPDFLSRLRAISVLPIVTIDNVADAAPLANALLRGGISAIEVTLRTKQSLEAIRVIANEVPEIEVGAGTIREPRQIEEALEAGARFLVSPGLTPHLAPVAAEAPVPFLPGVATATEAMSAASSGFPVLKFFPAEAAGGVGALEAMVGPLPDILFCPTGGIGPDRIGSYLRLSNVVCVGGSWMTPKTAIECGNWSEITALAQSVRATRAVA